MNKHSKGFVHLILIIGVVLVGVVYITALILPKDKQSFFSSFWVQIYNPRPQTVENYVPSYHKLLEIDCEDRNHDSCCITSVKAMAKGNFKLPTDDKCPKGFKTNQLRCIDSYKWCEPVNSILKNWKIYRNETLDYSFKYPSDWSLSESMSMWYPYITIVDPVAQAQPPEAMELMQGALIEIYVEEYRSTVSVEEYLKNTAWAARDKDGQWLEVQTEVSASDVWGEDTIHLVNHSGDILQHTHAIPVNYPEKDILYRIVLTIPDITSAQTNVYLETFDNIIANLSFDPPVSSPEADYSLTP